MVKQLSFAPEEYFRNISESGSKKKRKKSPGVQQRVGARAVAVVFIFWNSFSFYLTDRVKSFFIYPVDELRRAATARDTFEGAWTNLPIAIKAGQLHVFTAGGGRCFSLLLAEFSAFIATRPSLCALKKS